MPRLALPETWDEETDVVVIGCGYAGAVAALSAHDTGARVILVEKMLEPGGISVCSAGGVRVAEDAEAAFDYLRETNGATTPDPVLRTLAKGMTEVEAFVRALGKESHAVISRRTHAGNYPFSGHRTFGFVYVDDIPGIDPAHVYPHARGSKAGALLFRVLQDNLHRRGIQVRTEIPARRLFSDGSGVRGVQIESGGRLRSIHAKRGVILACGGFEASPEMQAQFWQGKPVLSAAVRGNTGDGIRMAQELGADLWHMWHYHGSYGIKHSDPAYPYGIRTKRLPDWLPGEGPRGDVVMTWIVVDRSGRRFMNEYPPYLQDTGARPLEPYDANRQRYDRIPCWLITDEAGRKRYPLGRPTYNDPTVSFEWSADNTAEIELGIVRRAAGIPELARLIEVDAGVLAASIGRWNQACARQDDPEFGRPPSSMMAIAEAPFYAVQLWPVVSNTQGGPRHDERQRIVDAFGAPIPRLYAAGELGSVFGHLYMSGGNLAECFIGGRIAGRGAAGETPQ